MGVSYADNVQPVQVWTTDVNDDDDDDDVWHTVHPSIHPRHFTICTSISTQTCSC